MDYAEPPVGRAQMAKPIGHRRRQVHFQICGGLNRAHDVMLDQDSPQRSLLSNDRVGHGLRAAVEAYPHDAELHDLARWGYEHDHARVIVAAVLPYEHLYFDRSASVTAVDAAEVDEIAAVITSALVREEMFPNFRNGPIWDGPLWLNNPTVTARAYVMMAMGMVSVSSGLTLDDSLAALRAHAYAAGRTVDAIASDVVNRVLPTAILADN